VPFLSLASEARPQGLALADAVGTLSYTELRCRAEEVGRRLVTAGLRPGDLVAVKGTLDRDFVATLHGVWMAGGIVAPMSTRWTPSEEQQALLLLRPRMSYPPPLRATRGHETRRLEGPAFAVLCDGAILTGLTGDLPLRSGGLHCGAHCGGSLRNGLAYLRGGVQRVASGGAGADPGQGPGTG
jgi:hypothetical protein